MTDGEREGVILIHCDGGAATMNKGSAAALIGGQVGRRRNCDSCSGARRAKSAAAAGTVILGRAGAKSRFPPSCRPMTQTANRN